MSHALRTTLAASLASASLFGACRAAAPPEPATPVGPRVAAGHGTEGFQDGVGAEARFRKPIRLAALGADSVVVADIYNHAIREVHLDGRVVTLLGGPDRKGHADGVAQEARIASPHGVAVGPGGAIAVAEASNHTVRLMTPSPAAARQSPFVVSTLAGAPGEEGLVDGLAAQARFRSPHAVLWDRDGSLLVCDIGNARVRRVRDGRVETVVGAEKGTFVYPMDIAWAKDGRLLIADAGANLIRTWSTAAGVGTLPTDAPLHTPHGVAAGPDGTVYVADMNAHQVVAIGGAGRVRRVFGTGQKGAGPDQLNKPAAVLVHAGHLWIADLDNHRIVVVPLAP
jgi:DNA-binding beta-propeller fold protein YncE